MQEEYLKNEIIGFKKYIETEKSLLNESKKTVNDSAEKLEKEMKYESREFKRFITKYTGLGKMFDLSNKYTAILDKYFDEILDFLNNENYNNENYKLDIDFDISSLIQEIILYYKGTQYTRDERLEKMMEAYKDIVDPEIILEQFNNIPLDKIDSSVPKYIIKLFVKNLKTQNIKSQLLSCFDDNGDVILEKTILLNITLDELYEKEKKKNKKNKRSIEFHMDKEEFIFTLINKEDLEKAREISKEKNKIRCEEKRKKLEEEKRKELEKIEKLKSKNIHNKRNEKNEKREDPKHLLLIKYINPYTHNIKKDVVEKLRYEEFSEVLSRLDLTKAEINKYLEEYLQIQFEKNIACLPRLIDQKSDLKKLKEIIKNPLMNEILYKKIRGFVLQSNFTKMNDKERKIVINRLLKDNTISSNQKIQNLIVFNEENLLDNELDLIFNTAGKSEKDESIKGIYHHLLTLKNTNLEEIKANMDDAFHVLYGKGAYGKAYDEYIIGNKLKGYRYGSKKIKIFLGILSATEENKKRLQERYNTDINSNILLVFGAGSVRMEDEQELFARMKKYGLNNSENILYIYDLFANPFTDETFKIACDLIDNSFIKIDDIKPKEKELVLETK